MSQSLIYGIGPDGKTAVALNVDASGQLKTTGSSGGGSAADREMVVSTFKARVAGTGYSIGDTITATRVLDVSGATPSQVGATVWYNETTAAALGTTPTASNLDVAGMPGLTDAQLRASGVPVAVASTAARAAAAITRPANVTAYSAGDVVGGALTFSAAGPTAGHVVVTSLDLRYDVAAIPSGMSSFRLYLYSVTPPSALADNAAWDLPSGDRASFIGYIDLGSIADLGSTLFAQIDGVNKQVKLGAAETALYGYLVTQGGYTPAANSETAQVTLRTVAL